MSTLANTTPPTVAVSPSRVRHAVVAVCMQILIGVVYSWSVFRAPLAQLHGWSKAQTVAPYRVSLLMVSAGMVIAGLWQDRRGARIVASTGGVMLAVGCVLAIFFGDTVLGLALTYGLLVGLGGGFAYVTPIANLVKWFPDKRGMMVGLAVMGNGLSPLFWAPFIEALIGKDPSRFHQTIPRAFLIMAGIFVVGVIGLAQLYRLPPPGWTPAGWTPPQWHLTFRDISTREMLTTWHFYALWVAYFLGTSVGLTAIGQASTLFQEVSRAGTLISGGVALGIMGVFNGAGRLSWGTVSDRFGRKGALLAMSVVSAIACLAFLRTVSGPLDVLAGLCLAAFAYGGILALMPALTADYFGPKYVGGNYGMLFSAWGLCGFVVPGYFEGILDRARATGNLAAGYQEVYWKLAVAALIVAVMALFLRPPATAPGRR
jgi:MFS transporter, OFA family, oxalate/formate antiporter